MSNVNTRSTAERENLLLELAANDIVPVSSTAKLSQNEYAGSYNWLDGERPEILVPGAPARWQPPHSKHKLKADRGDDYIDENAARYGAYPMEPAVRAVSAMNPGCSITADIVMCRNSMTKLFGFIDAGKRQVKPFQMDVHIVGGAAVFVRQEQHLVARSDKWKRVYPRAFKGEYTAWDGGLEGSSCHVRINRFDFAGLTYLLRHECDGYSAEYSTPVDAPAMVLSPADDPADKQRVHISAHERSQAEQALKVRVAGKPIAQTATMEIKTRSCSNPRRIDPEQELHRLWSSQTALLVGAHHDLGFFHDVAVHELQSPIREWESRNADPLRRLDALVRAIVDAARGCKSLKCHVVKAYDSDRLRVYALDDDYPNALPANLHSQLRGRFGGARDDPMDLSDA